MGVDLVVDGKVGYLFLVFVLFVVGVVQLVFFLGVGGQLGLLVGLFLVEENVVLVVWNEGQCFVVVIFVYCYCIGVDWFVEFGVVVVGIVVVVIDILVVGEVQFVGDFEVFFVGFVGIQVVGYVVVVLLDDFFVYWVVIDVGIELLVVVLVFEVDFVIVGNWCFE